MNARKARQDSKYSREERAVIGKYKAEYRSQTTMDQRGHIFKSSILPDIFNHWTNNGTEPIAEDEMKEKVKVPSISDTFYVHPRGT